MTINYIFTSHSEKTKTQQFSNKVSKIFVILCRRKQYVEGNNIQ